MSSRENRRLLVLVIVALLFSVLAAIWYQGLVGRPTTEERAREKAEELRERVRDLTRGK